MKLLCIANIEADLSIDNVCRALTVADEHGAASLKDTCVEFIVRHFPQVHLTGSFRELPRALLDLVHQGISACLAAASSASGVSVVTNGVERMGLNTVISAPHNACGH